MISTQLPQFYHATRNLIKLNIHGQKLVHGTYIKNVWISPRKSAKNILTINWSLSYLLFVQKDV